MSATNIARVEWNAGTMQNIAVTTNDVRLIFNRWSNLQRMNATNVASVEWNACIM
jgi:hypothetical protein